MTGTPMFRDPDPATAPGRQIPAQRGPQERQSRSRAGRGHASSPELDAVLFDMDGVVTDTATMHAEAWRQLFDDFLARRAAAAGVEPHLFDVQRDYRRYVDGKPRYDGVTSFLESRGISVPYGRADDPSGTETVCGLGNTKDGFVTAWLAANRVATYPGTLRLIDQLRAAGVRTAVFSSSRNASAVLASAGVLEIFDARVDGTDLARLGIPGKPNPAMLWEAAHRIVATPARCAIVEDSIAGVVAGADGGFGFVVGVDRSGRQGDDEYRHALVESGASVVVEDLSELSVAGQALVLTGPVIGTVA